MEKIKTPKTFHYLGKVQQKRLSSLRKKIAFCVDPDVVFQTYIINIAPVLPVFTE